MSIPFASHPLLVHGLARLRRWNRPWMWTDVVFPMAAVRLSLLLVGWLSQFMTPDHRYPVPEAVARNWHFSQSRLLDMWARWDSGWYFGIIRGGYIVSGDVRTEQNNIAFFPLYPYLIKALIYVLPEGMQTSERVLIVGLVVSQIFLIAALILLHKLVSTLGDRELARRTVLYVLLFPAGFFLFCFYTESTFLFLSVAAFFAASRKAWGVASVLGGLLCLTRPLGVLISVPLLWMYLESIAWKPLRVQWSVLWFLLIPAGLLTFLLYAYHLTGDFLAPVHAQQAWQKEFAMPWNTLFNSVGGSLYVMRVEQVLTILFLALAVWALFKLPSAAYGIYALLLILPPLTTGTLISSSRYYVVVFPVFIVMAMLGSRPVIDGVFKLTLFSLQVLFVIAWSQFYWVG